LRLDAPCLSTYYLFMSDMNARARLEERGV
jgi:hypothetical protein